MRSGSPLAIGSKSRMRARLGECELAVDGGALEVAAEADRVIAMDHSQVIAELVTFLERGLWCDVVSSRSPELRSEDVDLRPASRFGENNV